MYKLYCIKFECTVLITNLINVILEVLKVFFVNVVNRTILLKSIYFLRQ